MLFPLLLLNQSVKLHQLGCLVNVLGRVKLDLILNLFILVVSSSVAISISAVLILIVLVSLAKLVNKGGSNLYDTYTRYLYEFIRTNFPDLLDRVDSLLSALAALQLTADHLLQSVLFFGFLFWGFKFIKQRWLTVC